MLTLALAACAASSGWAQLSMPTPGLPFNAKMPVMPQDDVLPATLDTLYQYREDIDQVLVTVEMGQGVDNPQWLMSATQREVLLDSLLQFMPEKPQPEDMLWPKLKKMDRKYKGFRIVMRTVWGRNIAPITIFEGKVSAENGALLAPDYGRRMEYWMFGTSRIRRDQMVGAAVLPVFTFEQCRLLGQPIVHTRPRQCLLPDNNLLLETSEMPTLQSARIANFDECLINGKALIYTFPRRCVAAGGRVFTEPPRVYEVPGATADAASTPIVMGTSATQPSPQRMQIETGGLVSGTLLPAVSGTQAP
ncbi:MAG: hypothetical protein DI628_08220 [Blastochloris viridis]|uniref:Uncharacterized protein n=1 Tax=Blastochloris viridis TaxID=1079 RepID=A0A6N4R145_BLAVI|nr:MAG: hypothetical protein DI628_08220 [Blastochloris viridis]